MDDPIVARKEVWLKQMKVQFECDESTVIIGHSSGAEAAMRFAETNKVCFNSWFGTNLEVFGIVLVSACYTDLGDANERESGYYADPWQWEAIKSNTKFITQFGSTDDPFIPMEEMEFVAKNLESEYIGFDDRGHFQKNTFPELYQLLTKKVKEFNDS